MKKRSLTLTGWIIAAAKESAKKIKQEENEKNEWREELKKINIRLKRLETRERVKMKKFTLMNSFKTIFSRKNLGVEAAKEHIRNTRRDK